MQIEKVTGCSCDVDLLDPNEGTPDRTCAMCGRVHPFFKKGIIVEISEGRYAGVPTGKLAYRASFNLPHDEIKGCPLGRGDNTSAAIADLIYRTNMESGTDLGHEDLKVVTTRDFTK